jgi:tetratricopeptide (TPR) repeat protein
MQKAFLLAASAAAALVIAMPAWSMGGGAMTSPSYGNMGSQQLDDYSQARRLIRKERYADAIPYLQRALQDRPRSADILNYLGYTERMTGDYSTSLAYYKQALAIDPDHKGAHEYLGELFLTLKDITNANAQLAELTRICPSGCDERDTLTKSIATYVAANPAPATTAATTPTAPATTTPASATTTPASTTTTQH